MSARVMTPNTCPLTHFREFVVRELQKAPYGWGGAAGYELERRYNDLTQQYWDEGETVEDTAAAIHKLHMSRSQKVTAPTRASLEQAGCVFPARYRPSPEEVERSERQGDLIARFRAEY